MFTPFFNPSREARPCTVANFINLAKQGLKVAPSFSFSGSSASFCQPGLDKGRAWDSTHLLHARLSSKRWLVIWSLEASPCQSDPLEWVNAHQTTLFSPTTATLLGTCWPADVAWLWFMTVHSSSYYEPPGRKAPIILGQKKGRYEIGLKGWWGVPFSRELSLNTPCLRPLSRVGPVRTASAYLSRNSKRRELKCETRTIFNFNREKK